LSHTLKVWHKTP